MRIPAGYAPLLSAVPLCAIMVGVISARMLWQSRGLVPGFLGLWRKSVAIAFPTVLLVAPMVRRLLNRLSVG